MSCLYTLSSGGREVAGSSPVIPTKKKKAENQKILGLFSFYLLSALFSGLSRFFIGVNLCFN